MPKINKKITSVCVRRQCRVYLWLVKTVQNDFMHFRHLRNSLTRQTNIKPTAGCQIKEIMLLVPYKDLLMAKTFVCL